MAQVNNHVHSTFSFSPYAPEEIPAAAKAEGLLAVGLMDHDSVGGADAFLSAARDVGIASTVGCEIRVDFSSTPFGDRRVNNPDSVGNIYMSYHGIPAPRLPECDAFLAPIRAARNVRNREETERLNTVLAAAGLAPLDFDADILPLSEMDRGGSVTERHILYALAKSMVAEFGVGPETAEAVRSRLNIPLTGVLGGRLEDSSNPHYAYDLLGAFKSALVPSFFVQPGPDECVDVREAVAFGKSLDAIVVYPYLGDVGESPTGDKAAQRFEDVYLGELFAELKNLGFQAITYMPPRNTEVQLARVRALCARFGFMEISGIDINSSRQKFVTPILDRPEFGHLREATWALIAHEKLAAVDPLLGMFANRGPLTGRGLDERLMTYAEIGERLDPRDPEGSAATAAKDLTR